MGGTTCADFLAGTGGAEAVTTTFGSGATQIQPMVGVTVIGHNDGVVTFEDLTTGFIPLMISLHTLSPKTVWVVTSPADLAGASTFQTMLTWLSGTALPYLQSQGLNVRLVDLWTPLQGHPEWFAVDGHPNDAGYSEIATLQDPAVAAAITDAIAGLNVTAADAPPLPPMVATVIDLDEERRRRRRRQAIRAGKRAA